MSPPLPLPLSDLRPWEFSESTWDEMLPQREFWSRDTKSRCPLIREVRLCPKQEAAFAQLLSALQVNSIHFCRESWNTSVSEAERLPCPPAFPGLDLCTWLWVLMTSVATAAKLAEYLARVLGRGEGRELLPEVWIILNSGTTCKTFTSCYSLKLYSTSKRTHIILIQVNFLAIQMVYYTT